MSVEYKDYYKLLDVSKSASKEEIAKSFKRLAKKYHPDLNPDDKTAENKFKEINEAYEVLKDKEKRKMYDQLGPNWKHGQQFSGQGGFTGNPFAGGNYSPNGSSSFSDFFEILFGGGENKSARSSNFGPDPFASFSQRSRKGHDIEVSMRLTLEEAYSGGKKNVTLQLSNGSIKKLEVNIPKGIKAGNKIRLANQGEAGFGANASAGDLYIIVDLISHKDFTVDDTDITYNLFIAPWEGVLGAKVRVPTLDGEIELNIPPGSSSHKKFRLRGKGLGTGSNIGDQFVVLHINIPESLTDEEKELWEELAKKASPKNE